VTADRLRETLLRRLCVPQDGSGYV
jgi:hypothetical protein